MSADSTALGPEEPIEDSYFCSELVAGAYQAMGLLSRDLPAADFWPRSFESAKPAVKRRPLELIAGAKLGEEQLIDFSLGC